MVVPLPTTRWMLATLLALTVTLPTPPLAWSKPAKHSMPSLPPVATINEKRLPAQAAASGEDDLGPVTLSAVTTPATLQTRAPVTRLEGSMSLLDPSNNAYQTLMRLQSQLDDADLNKLWLSTVERNPVVRFSLEKLATPTDSHPRQSSQFLNRTLNVLISGATLAAMTMPGASAYQNMAAMAGGDAVRNVINGQNKGPINPLTPTEQIQLAGMVDDLRTKLVQAYQDYRAALQHLVDAQADLRERNLIYSQAMASKNELAVLSAGSAFFKSQLNEQAWRQKAKQSRLTLERLAGREVVEGLQLAVGPVPPGLVTAPANPAPPKATTPAVTPQPAPATSAAPAKAVAPAVVTTTAPVGPEQPPAAKPASKSASGERRPIVAGLPPEAQPILALLEKPPVQLVPKTPDGAASMTPVDPNVPLPPSPATVTPLTELMR